MQERTIFEEKVPRLGEALKKMKEISEHLQQSLPLSDMTKDIITNQSLIHNYFSSLIQV